MPIKQRRVDGKPLSRNKGINVSTVVDGKTVENTSRKSNRKRSICFTTFMVPLLLTIVSFYLRYYELGANNTVVWDEAHFAKFGSFYNRHTFYHDVHPPLGKMLCGLSNGWLDMTQVRTQIITLNQARNTLNKSTILE